MGESMMNGACNGTTHEEEVILVVSQHLASLSIGFTLDAGGSCTKLIYRSKDDYNNLCPKDPSSTNGKLRLRYFRSWLVDADRIIEFIRDHCDMQVKPEGSETDWWQTGVLLQHSSDKLLAFGVRTKLMSEVDGITCGLKFCSDIPSFRAVPLSLQSVDIALTDFKVFMTFMKNSQDGCVFGDSMPMFEVETYIMKLMMADATTLAAELDQDIKYPCLIVMCGSAQPTALIYEDGRVELGDFTAVSSKSFLGLGRALTGAKDFNELISMASRGDHSKVDQFTGELKNKSRTEVDWYSLMPDTSVVFALGKMAEEQFDGTYSKEDIASGLLEAHCSTVAHMALLNARVKKVKSVVFVGSFMTQTLVRESVERWFIAGSLMQPLFGEKQSIMHTLPNPGFLNVFGAWYKNLQLDQQTH